MLREEDLRSFINNNNYDLRRSKNGRWIDQKCTPDVLNIVADCVYQFIFDDTNEEKFSSKDIWRYEYTKQNVEDIFSKPSTNNGLSENEYDKFFSQPLEMLANARVLDKIKDGRKNFYVVNDLDVLEYISLRERDSLNFIKGYCEKVLFDSGIWGIFENFFNNQSVSSFYLMKEKYEDFIITNTPINGKVEVRRIFTKILNPLANARHKRGTIRGRLSKNIIKYSDLMYNRENFRDVFSDKPKGVSRQEWEKERKSKINEKYYKYQSQKAKRFLRKFNDQYYDGNSELQDNLGSGNATQMHHIFPASQFPQISMYLENLIALTPTQHLTKAHPQNNTQRIDKCYQEILLKAKASSIEENLEDTKVETIYFFDNLIEVLSTGFDSDYEVEENDFVMIMNIITCHYNNLSSDF